MGSITRFVGRKIVSLCYAFLSSVSVHLLLLLSFISKNFFRPKKELNSSENYPVYEDVLCGENNTDEEADFLEPEDEAESGTEKNDTEFRDSENDDEAAQPGSFLTFKFPTFEEFSINEKDIGDSVNSEEAPFANTSKNEFTSEESLGALNEEPECIPSEDANAYSDVNSYEKEENVVDEPLLDENSEEAPFANTSKNEFTSEESLSAVNEEPERIPSEDVNAYSDVNSYEKEENVVDEPLLDENLKQVHEDEEESSVNVVCDVEEKKPPPFKEVKAHPDGKEEKNQDDQELLGANQFNCEKNSLDSDSDSDSDSMGFEHVRSVMTSIIDSYSDGFLSDGDFGGEYDLDALVDIDGENAQANSSNLEENEESDVFNDDEDCDIMEEMRKLEADVAKSPNPMNSEFLSEKDFVKPRDEEFEEKVHHDKDMNGADNSESHKLESLWEHQELIEQLKMELRKVRATGLPTILEESEESPKISDDLKPWKIEEKFHHEDCMDELHKFDKSYRERMRKFDILNYQKMYAMGFLQLKDPLQSMSRQKPSGPTLKSLVSQNLWLFRHRSHDNDPMKKFIKELESDLEVVYVGQMCLSWEFLHWQYDKVLDLWDSDPRGIHRYNEVAGEFQQFQVLMQRFIEDEPFQGPRVQHYIKTRCVLRNLLQVPVIREDKLKDRKKSRRKEIDEYVITSDMLVEIVEESIRIFWKFVQTDKDCTTSTLKGQKRTPELQNPEDLELLTEIRRSLLKKEKKLKDILRSENCIWKKFRQCREDDIDQVLYFFSQLDMKLVSRVINMSKITRDQLIWCHSKLNRISFANRKIYVEPSFLLYPC